MKQVLLRALAGLMAVSTVVLGADRVAEILPEDTMAYARLNNVGQLHNLLTGSGLKGQVLREIREGSPRSAGELEGWDRIAGEVRSLHVSFHGATRYRRHVNMQILLVADVGRSVDPPEWLPPMLGGTLVEVGRHGQTQLYEVARDDLRDKRLQVLIASADTKVMVSTDLLLLEDALGALKNGRAKSLAGSANFREVTEGLAERDILLYAVVPEFVRTVAGVMNRRRRADLLSAAEMLSLDDSRCACYAADYAGSTGVLRLQMDPDSRAYELVAQPPVTPKSPDCVPAASSMLLSVHIGDGQQTWQTLSGYLRAKLPRIGKAESVAAYDRNLKQRQEELAVEFEHVAGLVDGEIGVFCGQSIVEGKYYALGFVRDRAEAERVMRDYEGTYGSGGSVQDIGGAKLHAARDGGPGWTIIEDCLLFGPEPRGVGAAISAKQRGTTLGGSKSYGALAARLHPRSAWLFVLNVEYYLKAVEEWDDLDRPAQEWLNDLLVGASLTAENGIVEVRTASSKEAGPQEVFTIIRSAREHRTTAQPPTAAPPTTDRDPRP